MKTPKIKRNLQDRSNGYGCLIILLPVIACMIMLICYTMRHTRSLYKDAADDVFTPSKEGFVGQANALFDDLLLELKQEVHPDRMRKLNDCYYALEFALPYNEDEIALAEDIRLIDINEQYIPEDKKDFYYNSNLPSLLRKQRNNLEDKIFRIYAKPHNGYITIDSIRLNSSMFRVALNKNPWSGSVFAQSNCLFDSLECAYLIYGQSVLPLPKFETKNDIRINQKTCPVKMDLLHGEFVHEGYYNLYQRYNEGKRPKLNIGDGSLELNIVNGRNNCVDSLFVKPENDIDCIIYQKDSTPLSSIEDNIAFSNGCCVQFEDGMQIVVLQNGIKLAELSLSQSNPIYELSSLTETYKGKSRFYADGKYIDNFTKQVVHGLAGRLSNTLYPSDVYLSIDPILSYELQEDMRKYVQELKPKMSGQSTWDMSVTIMDMNTGCVIASPYVSDLNDRVSGKLMLTRRNPAFIRRYIGSTFKPLLALAAVQARPNLFDLNLDGYCKLTEESIYDKATKKPIDLGTFFGAKTGVWAKSHWNRACTFTQFLAWSDDVYPVALASLALVDDANAKSFQLPRNAFSYGGNINFAHFKKGHFSDFRFAKILSALYKVNSYSARSVDSLKMYNYVWRNLKLTNEELFSLSEISPEDVVMHYDEFEDTNKTLYGEYKTWVLGQGNNEWNCIKLAEAYTRMLTKRERWASFLQINQNPSDVNLVDSIAVFSDYKKCNDTWNKFLIRFSDAQSLDVDKSTLKDMSKAVDALNGSISDGNNKLKLFSKTGTPDSENYERREVVLVDGSKRTLDVGLYCFALLTEKSYHAIKENKQNETKGVMCVVRITRSYEGGANGNGLGSAHARNFFSADQERLKKLYEMTKKYY